MDEIVGLVATLTVNGPRQRSLSDSRATDKDPIGEICPLFEPLINKKKSLYSYVYLIFKSIKTKKKCVPQKIRKLFYL